MQTGDSQRKASIDIGDQEASSRKASRQFVIADIPQGKAAQDRVPVPGDARHPAVFLNDDVCMARQAGDLVDLRAVPSAPTAQIDFLQADNVVARDLARDIPQRFRLRRRMNQLEVGAKDIVPIPAGADPSLNIPSQQFHIRYPYAGRDAGKAAIPSLT